MVCTPDPAKPMLLRIDRLCLLVAARHCWLTSIVTRHHVVSDVEAQLEVPGTVTQVYLVLQDVHAVVHVLVAANTAGEVEPLGF